jgi:hypothetical protein
VRALFAAQEDLEALVALMSDPRGSFEFQPGKAPTRPTMADSLDYTLLQVIRRLPSDRLPTHSGFSAEDRPRRRAGGEPGPGAAGSEDALFARIDGSLSVAELEQLFPGLSVGAALSRWLASDLIELQPASQLLLATLERGAAVPAAALAIDLRRLASWEAHLGRPVERLLLRRGGLELEFSALAKPDLGPRVQLATETLLFHQLRIGDQVEVRPKPRAKEG